MRESLDHLAFVHASYAVTLIVLAALLIGSWVAMRRAEARRDAGRDG